MKSLDEYWKEFLQKTGRESDTFCSGDLNFDSNGIKNDTQIILILNGKKTAFFSSYASFSIDGEELPASGELYLVLDRANNPCCVIELQSVNIVPFNEVTWQMAKQEGEDENLEEWKIRKQEDLEDEGQIVGFEFTQNMRLIFQTFNVVYK